jgi:hypothetical protein
VGLGITLPEEGSSGWGPVLTAAVEDIDDHLWERATYVHTTASLADAAQETTTIPIGKGCEVIRVQVDRGSRVRMYDTTAHATADAGRPRGTPPDWETSDVGIMLDMALTAAGARTFGPAVDVKSREATAVVPITVDNLSGAPSTVQVTITYRRTE